MVYVRWYGKVVAGNVVKENDLFGMTAVKIPVQGVMATALFMPGHVFQTAEEAQRETAGNGGGSVEKQREVAENVPKLSPEEYIAKVYVNDLVQRFKQENWDTERNHLRIDKLDEFYQLWRKTHDHTKPDVEAMGTVATPAEKPQDTSTAAKKPEAVKADVKPQRVKKQKPIKATQLSLFD